MDRGKRKVEEPALNEVERRERRARRDYEIVAEQFWPLVGQVDRFLEQHRAPQQGYQGEQKVSDSPALASQGLLDIINSVLERLEGNGEASGSGSGSSHDVDAVPVPELPPADPTPEEAAKPEVPPPAPTDVKREDPLVEPKHEASSPSR